MESLYSAVVLSRGSVWKPEPGDQPYLIPHTSGLERWPDRSTTRIVFTDTKGADLLKFDGRVFPDRLEFVGSPAQMDKVPAGANFTIYLETKEGPFSIRHGKVIRKEVTYTTPPAQADVVPLTITDNLQRTAAGNWWKPVYGRIQISDNSDDDLPYAMMGGPGAQKSAVRYIREFSTDGIEIGVTLLNVSTSSPSWTSVNFGADINFEMGCAVKFETGASAARKLHIGTLTAPMTIVDRAPVIANTVVNLEYYRIVYIDSVRTVSVYKGTSLDPISTWTDDTKIVPHGFGYRHVGFSFYRGTPSATRGIQVASVTARDAA
ncbi:LtfC-like domain-containing protein [Mycolicibacterium fluoranthenivorans]|uniref:Minor tail protein n=1 Tax=Mycolicibacterium fluoranthenivorans TaxID=258505 RepID=A0A7X5ZG41_9MYCO|nr:hypothetical protein [Mycolicibacterium fluoranthenivorans]MCV7354503.1 hypothetical protein [Mycolicibacterium fluoranthenivorans]NIH98891.1 hypothetical protein [Mycolicibacterium fluoranthenivorans]